MILNASAENGSESSAWRVASRSSPPLTGSRPVTGGTSSGDGRYAMTASSRGCTPLFLNDEPHRTGVSWLESVALRMASTSRGVGISCSSRISSTSVVVVVRDLLEQVLAGRVGLVEQLARDVHHGHVLAEVVVVDDGLHGDEVDDALEVALGTDRQLDRHGVRAEAVDHRLDAALEIGADAVHLVDVGDARDGVLVRLAPDRLGLWLYTCNGVEEGDSTIENAQRALHLDREVHVAGRIDDVDAVISPLARGGGRRDRDTALLLLLHPVHRGGALVDLAHLVGLSGVIQDALGRRRLARIDVGHDPDVPGLFERELARHGAFSSLCAVFLRRVPRQRAKKRALPGPCRSHAARPCSRVGYVSRDSM